MRILHFTECIGRGGKERQIVELVEGLIPHRDIESFVAVTYEEDDQYEIDREHAQYIPLIRKGRRDLRLFKSLYDLTSSLKIDIVHSWGSICSLYAAPVAKLCGASRTKPLTKAAPHNFATGAA